MEGHAKIETFDYIGDYPATAPLLKQMRGANMALHARACLSREHIGKLERGVANPTIPATAQISHGIGMTLTEFVEQLEENE